MNLWGVFVFKVMSTRNIVNALIIILTIIILTVSGIILTKTIKNSLNNHNDKQSETINAEVV